VAIRRVLLLAVALVAVLAVGVLGVIGWYYSDEILTPIGGDVAAAGVPVEQVADGVLTLARTPESERPGRYAVVSETGTYAHVGAVVAVDADSVTRVLHPPVRGTLRPGDVVTFEGAYFPEDPAQAFSFGLEEVRLANELGSFPAYVDRRSPETWAIIVHGRGGDRRGGFRMVEVLHALDISSIIVTYRNDPGAPPSPDRLYGLGATEWRDLVPAARYAIDAGAQRIVLVGYSMGGAIVTQFLHEAPEAELVSAIVLDAPVLDWEPVLDLAAADRGLPAFLTDVAMLVTELRTEVSFAALDQIDRAAELDVPVLVIHGTEDSTVPIATSEAFARARPDLVMFLPVRGAEHTQAWNVDPGAYAQAVTRFLQAA
jgi:pimeloyl-ACP methyl ester carboxylesterase